MKRLTLRLTLRLMLRLAAAILTFWLGSALAGLFGPVSTVPAWRDAHSGETPGRLVTRCQDDRAAHLQMMVEAEPHNASRRLALGDAYIGTGCYDEAVGAYREAVALDPASSDNYEKLANAYNHLSCFREVVALLTEGLRRHPRAAYLWNELGFAYEGLNRTEDAARAFARAAQFDPGNAYAQALLAHCEEKLGRRAEAYNAARQAIAVSQRERDDAAMNNAVMALVALGEDDEALAAADRSAEINPGNPYKSFQYGHLYTLRGQPQEAAAAFRQVLAASSLSPTADLLRGWARLFLGDGAGAAAEARQYLGRVKWQGVDAPRAGLIAYLGYRLTGQPEPARAILAEIAAHREAPLWPYEIARYLQGELGEGELLELAADRDELTEAHAFIGINLALAGENGRAREHFRWVEANGTRSFIEYAYAVRELAR